MSVIPDTGFEPTMAVAFAATVVNRKEITRINMRETIVNSQFCCITPKNKNAAIASITATTPMPISLKERSF